MIETTRLLLRWPEPGDFAAHAAIHADREAMALFGPVTDEAGTRTVLERHAGYRERRLGFWSVIERESGGYAGFCGLKPGAEDTPIAGEIEIGWLIARSYWGRGFAREAAAASLAYAWSAHDAARVVAIISEANEPSHRVARALGMERMRALDFLHPALAADDPLAAMWVYAVGRPKAGAE